MLEFITDKLWELTSVIMLVLPDVVLLAVSS